MNDIKQVIVLRTKYPSKNGLTGVRTGKLVAQGCHASNQFIVRLYYDSDLAPDRNNKIFQKWANSGAKKIVLQVESEEDIKKLQNEATLNNIVNYVITDSGLTEFGGIPTVTAIAIGPDESDKIDKITKHLKLL